MLDGSRQPTLKTWPDGKAGAAAVKGGCRPLPFAVLHAFIHSCIGLVDL